MSSGFENDERSEPADGSPAVLRASEGAEAWRAALEAQEVAVPDHADFYGLTRELVFTLSPLSGVMRVLSRQVAGYADSVFPDGAVYDDIREDDPRELLAQASALLAGVAVKVSAAGIELHRFWSVIGRIGVENLGSAQTGDESRESAP